MADLLEFALRGRILVSKSRATGILILYFVFSLGLIVFIIGASLYGYISTRLLSLLNLPFLLIGLAILVISCLGCVFNETTRGQEKEDGTLLAMSLCSYVILYLVVAGLAVFAVAVSIKGNGHTIPGRSYKEYKLDHDYSHWLRNKVNATSKWDSYRRHLIKSHVCSAFSGGYELDTLNEFYNEDLSPIEAGCCKPPDYCNFGYTSPTMWIKPKNHTFNSSTSDCNIWDNDPNTRCFNCESCKAGFLQEVKSKWLLTGGIILAYQFKQFLGFICLILCLLLGK